MAKGKPATTQPATTQPAAEKSEPQRPTSQWVDIGKVAAHPDNPNRMSPEQREKLRRNIEETGQVPPLICRSLELSQAFIKEFQQGLIQILDGEHRWVDAKDRGASIIEVRVWPGITDEKAKQLLLTLNRLQGKDDPAKRRALIRDLAEFEPDPEVLASFLPEDAARISKELLEQAHEAAADAAGGARERAASLSQQQPMTFFVEPKQAEVIRKGIKTWLANNDPQHNLVDCREGAALRGIGQLYLNEYGQGVDGDAGGDDNV